MTPDFITNLINLVTTATTWLLLLIPVVGGLMLGWFAWRKSVTEDEAQRERLGKLMTGVIKYGAIATGASGIVTSILSFF